MRARWGWTVAILGAAAGAAFGACTIINDEHVPPPVYPALLSLPHAASLCRWVTGCPELGPSIVDSLLLPLPPQTVDNFSACVDVLGGAFPAPGEMNDARTKALACVVQAKTCEAALDCMPIEDIVADDPRCSDVDAATDFSCDPSGQYIRYCTTPPAQIIHCNTARYGNTQCIAGSCAVAANCTNGDMNCNGNLVTQCFTAFDGGPTYQLTDDCQAQGQRCAVVPMMGGPNGPDCVNSLTSNVLACSPGATCQGSVLILCADSYEITYDCARVGATCSQDTTARCVAPGASCSPFDGDKINVCDGTKVSLCVNGETTSFDCASIGATCVGDQAGKHATCQ